ncbi:hypothetical protein BDV28DRAFT_160275 [Aspergillus coremiiformis]|uniref:Uncharacterized protein n=1 Tax=Aspergillus coremiiformis TaxID=138285 RepID=A0A5N6YW60_9EURO|nr:hypothetical protein BDV28DRAFT_160275 [Aspergillus coremiiformis]
MGLFGHFFSRPSACERNESRAWTPLGQTKSDGVNHHQGRVLLKEIGPDELVQMQSNSTCNEQASPPAHREQEPEPKGLSVRMGMDHTEGVSKDSSADFRRSTRGSRPLASFVTLLRPRKSRRWKSQLAASEQPDRCAVENASDRDHLCAASDNPGGHQSANIRNAFQCYNKFQEPSEARQVSDRTLHSHTSDLTSVTVCRHPSKCASKPIALVHQEHGQQNVFGEPEEPCGRLSSCNPFLELSMTRSSSATQASSQNNNLNREFTHIAGMFAKNENPFDQPYFRDYGSVSLVSSSRTVSRDSTWSFHIDRHTAVVAFNELAPQIHLDPLVIDPCATGGGDGSAVPASSTPDVFCTGGDLKLAARTYEYFANQVLSAEKVHDPIEMTVRRGEMPTDLIGVLDHDASRQRSLQVLSVGWVFKALVAGLPGGVLGSGQLYRILVHIYYGRIPRGGNEPRLGCVGGLCPQGQTQIEAMVLAILALTTPMQLNLICAFFGLCALLLEETARGGAVTELPGRVVLNLERLGHVLGPLLTADGGEGGQDTFRAIEREIESQRVMTMLIGSWPRINRQVRTWQESRIGGRRQPES